MLNWQPSHSCYTINFSLFTNQWWAAAEITSEWTSSDYVWVSTFLRREMAKIRSMNFQEKKSFLTSFKWMENINKFISLAQINAKLVSNIQSVSNAGQCFCNGDWQVTKAYTSQLYMTSGLKWENNNLFWRPPSLKLPARNKLGSLLTEALDESVSFSACLCPLVRSLMFHCTLFSSLTCSVYQHLPQFLLITGMDEVKHTVSRQVELQWREIYKYIFAVMHTANHLNPNVTKILNIFCAPLSHRL